ncbi:MAG: sulfate/molybdate ABC transporter ATP-binding protein [Gammaproteobacteria bacterium]|jgi:sulfate transport system ATP-binding protein|nr:sulfate/molybdate ABC transporter ATP-binding protein [Gammaproteobacteria bacterium]
MSIVIENVNKHFGAYHALRDVTLEIPDGELVALLGPSGCGKTSLLRIMAGLEQPDTGRIHFHGEDTTDRHVRERRVGFVFQHYALFRHMTVFDNIAFGLTVRRRAERPSREEIRRRVHELLDLVQLRYVADHFPNQLSGGQRQRIALARALAVEPKVLLLDEPFGALDANVRRDLRRWLRRLHDEIHVTSVFVTHDQEEAMEVSNRVVVMNQGRVEQIGTPEEVYETPATAFVSRFLGSVNLFKGRVHDGWAQIGDVRTPLSVEGTDAAVAHLRPHEIELSSANEGSIATGKVSAVFSVGPVVRIEVQRDGEDEGLVEVELAREAYLRSPVTLGEQVYIKPRNLRVYAGAAAAGSR